MPGRAGIGRLRVPRLNLEEGAVQCGQLVGQRPVQQLLCGLLGSASTIVQEDVDEVVGVLAGRAGACHDALGQEVSLQPGEADLPGHLGAISELGGQLLPREIACDIAGAAQVGSREQRGSRGDG